jgi:hypothetical protein
LICGRRSRCSWKPATTPQSRRRQFLVLGPQRLRHGEGCHVTGWGILLPLLVPPPAGREMIPPGGGVTYVLAPWGRKLFQGVRFRSRGRDGRAPGHRGVLGGSTAVFPRANHATDAEAQSAALHERKTDGHDNQDHPMAETLADQDRIPNENLEGKGETPQEGGESTEPRIPEKAWRS